MGLKIRHPGIAVFGEAVDEAQFRAVHAPKGWLIVPSEVVVANDILGVTVGSIDDLTVEQLSAVATATNVDIPNRATKPQLVAALKKSSVETVDADNPGGE